MTLTRLESFPFDSRYDGFDDEGYPVYDRAVGSRTLRDVFAHFFSDGVFSDTTYPFRLTKAASGLAVTVNPGVIIINGGWGILPEATTLTLATGTTAGVIKYAVFARYDNNDEHRTLYLRTDASNAGGAVPEPVTTEANVTEYRIGYITVPSNSTNLTNATITNEVGTSKCPYATPLFDIDPAEVLEDLRQDAQAAYDKYYALLQSALDGTTAGHLQKQLDEHDERIATLENEEIDAQALRAEMGLGNTTGVLGVEYGGTGASTLSSLREKLTPSFKLASGYLTDTSEYDVAGPTDGNYIYVPRGYKGEVIPEGLYAYSILLRYTGDIYAQYIRLFASLNGIELGGGWEDDAFSVFPEEPILYSGIVPLTDSATVNESPLTDGSDNRFVVLVNRSYNAYAEDLFVDITLTKIS